MSGQLRIRRAWPGDARAIARIHVETWRSAYAGILPDRAIVQMSVDEKAAAWRGLIERQRGAEAVLAAELAGNVLGFASCGPAGRATGGTGERGFAGEIHTLYVLPDWQEQGIGRALLCGCFRLLAAAGIGSAFLWVLADNPARFFYEAMGGRRVGERDEKLWGTLLHESAYGWHDLSDAEGPCKGLGEER